MAILVTGCGSAKVSSSDRTNRSQSDRMTSDDTKGFYIADYIDILEGEGQNAYDFTHDFRRAIENKSIGSDLSDKIRNVLMNRDDIAYVRDKKTPKRFNNASNLMFEALRAYGSGVEEFEEYSGSGFRDDNLKSEILKNFDQGDKNLATLDALGFHIINNR